MSITIEIFDLVYDSTKGSFILEANIYALVAGLAVLFSVTLGYRYWRTKKGAIANLKPVELELEFGGVKVKYEIERNYANIEIAHRIYVEMVTRKVAIPINEKEDVIKEIYDSWYALFQITREEIKKIPGSLLAEPRKTADLVNLCFDILNKGLRPHLTKHQAKFRMWYDHALKQDIYLNKSPQEIQRDYTEFKDLLDSLKTVNALLINYSMQLKRFVGQGGT